MEITTEVDFAQKLASNEKKQRDKAIKRLRKYIAAKSAVGFSEDDYLKIWKGLHYCMWMQDKPLIQEELSNNITRLVHVQKSYTQALLFVKVFFQTEAREWDGIDFWRIDKFMMFLRNMLTQAFLYLKNHKWNKKMIKLFVNVINDTLLDYASDVIPNGIRIHLSDMYLAELSKVGGDELTAKQILHFLTPFVTFIQHCKNLNIVHRVVGGIFYPLIQQTIAHFRKKEKQSEREKDKKSQITEDEDDEDTDDSDAEDDSKLNLKYDCNMIADMLFGAGSSTTCSAQNRKLLYTLVKRFRDTADGIIPKIPRDVGDTKVDIKDINKAVQALQTMEFNILNQNKKIKNKNKNTQDSSMGKKTADLKSDGQDEIVLLPNGKRKKKSRENVNTKNKKSKIDDTATKLKVKASKKSIEENSKETVKTVTKKKKKINDAEQMKGDNQDIILPAEDNDTKLNKRKVKKLKKKSKNVFTVTDIDSSVHVVDELKSSENKRDVLLDGSSQSTKSKKKMETVSLNDVENAVNLSKRKEKTQNVLLNEVDNKLQLSKQKNKTEKHKKKMENEVDKDLPLSESKKKRKSVLPNEVDKDLPLSETKMKRKSVLPNEVDKDLPLSESKNKRKSVLLNEVDKDLPLSESKNKRKSVLLNEVDNALPLSESKKKTESVLLNEVDKALPLSEKKKKRKSVLPNEVDNALPLSETKNKRKSVLPNEVDNALPLSESKNNRKSVILNEVDKDMPLSEKKKKRKSVLPNEVDNALPLSESKNKRKSVILNIVDKDMPLSESKNKTKSVLLNEVDNALPLSEKKKKRKSVLPNEVDNALPLSEKKKKRKSFLLNKIDIENKTKSVILNEVDKDMPLSEKKKKRKSVLLNEVDNALPLSEKKKKRKSVLLNEVDNALPLRESKKKNALQDKTIPDKTPVSSTKKIEMKKKHKKSAEPSIARNLMDEFTKPLEEGEVEIFVHTKKWKDKMMSTPVESGKKLKTVESAFAHFEKLSQTPTAFFRKLESPHTLPRKKKLQMADEAQCFSAGKKRVSFDPSRNMSRDFKDSVKFSSSPAYLLGKSPSQGILKSPAPGSSKNKKKKKLSSSPAYLTGKSPSLGILKKPGSSKKKTPSKRSPVTVNTRFNSRTTRRQSDISLNRATAADFF